MATRHLEFFCTLGYTDQEFGRNCNKTPLFYCTILLYYLPGVTEENPKDTEDKAGVPKIKPGTSKNKSRMSRFVKTLLFIASY
jgi:hypothetical protein